MLVRIAQLLSNVVLSSVILSGAAFSLEQKVTTPLVVVAGAGPASLSFVHRLLQLNDKARVHIYAKSGPISSTNIHNANDASFPNLSFELGDRAKAVMSKVPGVTERVESVATKTPTNTWMVDRQEMRVAMLDVLEEAYGLEGEGRLTITYNTEVLNINGNCTVEVRDCATDRRFTTPEYSLMVAGDGIDSSVRNRLVQMGVIHCKRFQRNVAWKTLAMPSQPMIAPGTFIPYTTSNKNNDGKKENSDEFGALIAHQNTPLVLNTFWLRNGKSNPKMNPFNDASSPQELRTKIFQHFPNVTELPSDELLRTFLDKQPETETYMKLDKHAVEGLRLALIGDSAVGMYSKLGQGCASGMERATLLAEMVTSSGGLSNLDQLEVDLIEFSRKSVAEGHAVTDLNLITHVFESRVFQRFAPMWDALSQQTNSPEISYSDVVKNFRWSVRLGRVLSRTKRMKQ